MQHASTMQRLPLPKNLRKGQREVIEKFYESEAVIAKLPTGYGKTFTAVCSYAVLRDRGIANRILYIVPRRNQAIQAADSLPVDLKVFGVKTKSTIIGDDQIVSIKRHRNNTSEVFITTIQSLVTSSSTQSTISELVKNGKWFVVIDEHHHYSNTGEWINAINSIPYSSRLVMSATPNRHDGKDSFPDPDVSVTYWDALKEGCVKEMHLHEYEYRVDAVTIDGNVYTYTTGDLFNEVGSYSPDDIDRFMASKKMRWSPKYISPLVTIPAERIADLRLRGVRTQMLVQALSCSHAEIVCEQIKAILPTVSVDWVGTGPNGRSQKDNEEILNMFCPPKNPRSGKREWTLDILVNVGMAGEGLDTTDVSEISFLTPVNGTISDMQTMGRAARVMCDKSPIAHINVDTETTIAAEDKYLGRKIMALFDSDIVSPDEIESNGDVESESEYQEMPDEPIVMITNVSLVDIKKDPMFMPLVDDLHKSTVKTSREECEQIVEQKIREWNEKRDEKLNATSIRAQEKQSVDSAVGKIVSLVMRRVADSGLRPDKAMAGDIKKRINSKKKIVFGSVKEADSDELREQYRWLKDIERKLLTNDGLKGLPIWLR